MYDDSSFLLFFHTFFSVQCTTSRGTDPVPGEQLKRWYLRGWARKSFPAPITLHDLLPTFLVVLFLSVFILFLFFFSYLSIFWPATIVGPLYVFLFVAYSDEIMVFLVFFFFLVWGLFYMWLLYHIRWFGRASRGKCYICLVFRLPYFSFGPCHSSPIFEYVRLGRLLHGIRYPPF